MERARELVNEQAALRQVAILVARESPPDQLFAAVTEQVARILAVPHVRLVRYEADGSLVVGGFSDLDDVPFPIGSRWPLDSAGVTATVRQTGRPARVEDYGTVTGEIAAAARDAGMHSAVACPIEVGRRLWGAMVVLSPRDEPLPVDTESRLAEFTELVATAIANTESRQALARLAEEQAALRRVAMIAAAQSSPVEVFGVVTKEAARVLETEAVGMLRFESNGTATLVAQSDTPWDPPPLGTPFPLDGENFVTAVHRTGNAARTDDWSTTTGAVGAMAQVLGVRSAVAAPIVVDGCLWGTLIAATSQPEPLAKDVESRLGAFTELVATAISNAESREALGVLANEQAALRRVAELVAAGVRPEDVFRAVSAEVGVLFGSDLGEVIRFEDDRSVTVFGATGGAAKRATPDPGYGVDQVRQTGRSARFDVDDLTLAESRPFAETLGIRSGVASPIVVEGRLWGAITAVSLDHALAPGAEHRLNEFTALIAAAISNAENRAAQVRLADEQAALRRVAELVAEGSKPEDVFRAVSAEVGVLFGSDVSAIVRFEDDGTATVLGDLGGPHVAGERVTLDPGYVVHTVRETGRSSRFDTDDPSAAEPSSIANKLGIRSAVASPIVVEGKLWGAITAASLLGPLAHGAEQRLNEFTGLLATAIGNTQSREQVTMLAEEQAALRRVATLVADEASQQEILSAIAAEIGPLMGIEETRLVRFVDDRSAVTVASAGNSDEFPVGEHIPAEPGSGTPVARVLETGTPVRIEDARVGDGPVAATLHRMGIRSGVCAPIYVEGRLWGSINTGSRRAKLPPDAESRLAQFTDLLATAIANTESRAKVARLAEEQAALRRVATLVAEDPESKELFSAVTHEVAGVMDVRGVIVERFEPDGSQVILGSAFDREMEDTDDVLGIGVRLPLHPGTLAAEVLATHRGARVENYSTLDGMMGDAARAVGIGSGCAAPIVVDGQLWGQMCVYSRLGQELPSGIETQLDDFVKLIATAISNFEAHVDLRLLADEQAALRRVATLVAHRARPADLFAAVAEEVGLLHGVDHAFLTRFDTDDTVTAMARWTSTGEPSTIALPLRLAAGPLTAALRKRPGPVRIDPYSDPNARAAELELGLRSSVAAPITVEGRTWGMIGVSSMDAERPPAPGTEERLTKFTDLVATAIANAESREALARLADEQAALRRVAEVIAREASPTDLLDTVAEEAARVLGIAAVGLLRFDPDGMATLVAGRDPQDPGNGDPGAAGQAARPPSPWDRPAPGTRLALDGENPIAEVLRTGQATRMDDWSSATGSVASMATALGVRSTVAIPIVVGARPWGALIVASSDPEPLPADTGPRAAQFAGLTATAIANAEARTERSRLVEEQAALRRVAELVAREASTADIFDAVVLEAASVLDIEAVGLMRFEPDATATVVAQSPTPFETAPLGTKYTLEGEHLIAQIARTGEAVRIDDWRSATGSVAEEANYRGVRSSVGTPIVAQGRLWGILIASTSAAEPLPADTEARIGQFAGLVATAISNAEARDGLAHLVEEQAALRRVATLVAAGVAPTVIFTAVSRELEHIFGLEEASTDRVTVIRFDPGPTSVVVGAAKDDPEEPIGLTWAPRPLYVSTKVRVTGASARIDEHELETVGGPDAVSLRRRGFLCQVGSPIVVRRQLWGAVTLNAGATLPPDTEKRLEKFTELVATAVSNAEAQSDLAASRRRIVSASDEARRRIERDLHDGTQQRLVSLGLALRSAEAMVPPDRPELRVALSDITAGLTGAVEDLQELSRGIHPAILSTGGLLPALRTLARRSAVPVNLDIPGELAVPESIEVAAYFVTSEALANAAKHARASHVDISLSTGGGHLVLAIRDDGVGGADTSLGSGLIGLADRVEALGGSVVVDSRPGEGTSITARLPIKPDS